MSAGVALLWAAVLGWKVLPEALVPSPITTPTISKNGGGGNRGRLERDSQSATLF